jgi:hypothetical protein
MPEPRRPLIVDAQALETLPNPYWEAVEPHVVTPPADWSQMKRAIYGTTPSIGSLWQGPEKFSDIYGLRADLVRTYSWAVTDPGSVRFVAEHSGGRLIDPMAGTGYWAYLLSCLGVRVYASDIAPPAPGRDSNHWHPDTPSFVAVHPLDCVEAVTHEVDPSYTLFLSWPPMSDDADRALAAYRGDKVIHIGELGGCTGDDNFTERLDKDWEEIDSCPIVQWVGIHDYISVYTRK